MLQSHTKNRNIIRQSTLKELLKPQSQTIVTVSRTRARCFDLYVQLEAETANLSLGRRRGRNEEGALPVSILRELSMSLRPPVIS